MSTLSSILILWAVAFVFVHLPDTLTIVIFPKKK